MRWRDDTRCPAGDGVERAAFDDHAAGVPVTAISASGVPFALQRGDVDADACPPSVRKARWRGDVDTDDRALINAAMDESVGDPGYDVRADLTLTGPVTSTDLNIWSANNGATLGCDALSEDPDEGVGDSKGYEHDPILAASWTLYHVRNRVYNADLGRWTLATASPPTTAGGMVRWPQGTTQFP